MPIYEYLCEGCGRISEVMQKLSDPPPRTCPECGSRKIAKLVSRTSFQLKGGGWYSDLYASKKEAKPAANESATKAPPPAGPAEGSTAKPSAAAETKASGKKASPPSTK